MRSCGSAGWNAIARRHGHGIVGIANMQAVFVLRHVFRHSSPIGPIALNQKCFHQTFVRFQECFQSFFQRAC